MWTLVLFFGSPQNSSVGTAAVLVPIFVQFTTLTPRCLFLLSLFFSVNVLGQSPFGHPGAKMSERWLTQYINKMWSRGLGHIPSCQQRSPHNVLHSQCLDASCQRLHPVGIEPVTSRHTSLTRLHILLMCWVNHLLDILAPRCPKGDWPNTLTVASHSPLWMSRNFICTLQDT